MSEKSSLVSKVLAEAYVGLIIGIFVLIPIVVVALLVKAIAWAIAG